MREAPRPIVGRHADRNRLEQFVDAVAASEPSFALLVGEAGIGKTTLLATAVSIARSRALRALRGVAIESGVALPYLPLLAPLRECLSDTPSGAAARIVRTDLLGEAATDRVDGEPGAGLSARLLEAVYELLTARPTLLAVDDVHWADQATVAVLDYLAHRAAGVPLGVVAAARDDEPDHLERLAIADGRRFVRHEVRPLSREEVRLQIEALGAAATPREIDVIHDRTAGNPFFVEQVLAVGGEALDVPGAAPPSLRALVLRRFRRLSAGARSAIEALAVLDRPSSSVLVAATAGTEPAAARDGLAEAIGEGLATTGEAPDTVGLPDIVRLRHPVFGEVVRGELRGPAGADLHRRAAIALEAASGEITAIAEHWWQTGDRERARAAALAAATASEQRHAFAEARLHLERAIRTWPDGEPGRVSILLRAGRAAWNAGDAAAALSFARATGAEPEADLAPIEVHLAQGAYAWDAGERTAAIEAFDRATLVITDRTAPALRSRALWGLGRGAVGRSEPLEAHRLAVAAAAAATEARDQALEAEALQLGGMALAWAGPEHTVEMLAMLERGLAAALASGSPQSIGHGYHFLADMRWIAGDPDAAIATCRAGIDASDRLGLGRFHGADLRGYLASFLLELGQVGDAAAVIHDAEPRALSEIARARVALRRGDRAAATAAFDRTTTAGSIGGPGLRGGWLEMSRLEAAALGGDVAAAARWLARVELVAGVWHVDVGCWRALWAARLGADLGPVRGNGAWAQLDADRPLLGRHADLALSRAIRLEVELLEVEHRPAPGAQRQPDGWSTVGNAWLAARRPFEACRAGLRQAGAFLELGERELARAALLAAGEAATALRCAPLEDEAADLARRSRLAVTLRRRRVPDPTELTTREREVLALLAEGMTNREIAERLFVSPKTADAHVTRILGKLDAHTRGEAVAIARRQGLLA